MRKHLFTISLISCLLLSNSVVGQIASFSPATIVEHQLNAYNAGDIDAFMEVFHVDIQIFEFGKSAPSVSGHEAVKNVYNELFNASPNLNSVVINRSVIGNKVIDYEFITGRNNSPEPLYLVMIYEIKDNKIYRATSIRQ